MKAIEPLQPKARATLTSEIRSFWSRNVNAERIMGRDVSPHARGSEGYFLDLQEQRYRSHRHLLPWIRAMRPGRTVLEIGCGVGLDSHVMARHGLQVTSVDLTFVGVQTAKHRFERENMAAAFAVTDACKLAIASEMFDYVYSFGVLHHAADTERTIKEVYRALKKGGEARIMLYHRRSLNELVHRLLRVPFEDRDELCPVVRRFTRPEILKMFSDFSRVEISVEHLFGEGYGLLFRLTPGWIYGLLSRYFGWHLMIVAIK
ncbi:MAG TPA: class I SAM-dependent methyltransferase [Gammaproteobacteria bacterium]|nr:class I SAM-dependent methyltransferase [Gammaproteobacteria bacterium]